MATLARSFQPPLGCRSVTKASNRAGERTGRPRNGQRSPSRKSASPVGKAKAARRSVSPATLTAVLVVLALAVVVGLTVWGSGSEEPAPATARGTGAPGNAELGAPVPADLLIRPDSHRIAPPAGDRVRFVEFLDLECEACRAAYPTVERLRAEYAGRVDFVARYFPLSGHLNAEPAAFATEAAARQGAFEGMYQRMYETQADWGDQQVDHAPTFRGFAQALGLDMARYDRDVADPTLRQRVLADRDDGLAAGVQGTPTFFVNDRQVQGDRDYATLKATLDQALATP